MSRLLLAAVLFAAAPAAAQSCSGVLRLELYDVDAEGHEAGRYVIPTQSLDVTASFFHGPVTGFPTAAEARRDPDLVLEAEEALSREARLYAPAAQLVFAAQCGLGLLHVEIGYWDETMTLDVYRAPNHVGIRLDAAVPFRPGRYVLDLETAPRVSGGGSPHVYAASAVRPAGG